MKTLIITGSRADRNGLEVVHEALLKAGHESTLIRWSNKYVCCGGTPWGSADVAVVGGDRQEILCAALTLSRRRIPIAHIAGGDVTEGSVDDRYRDAITALSCIHFVTNERAQQRICTLLGTRTLRGDDVRWVGSPAIDRIKQTPVGDRSYVLSQFCMRGDKPIALVCVHPNTVGPEPMTDAWAVCAALTKLEMQCICLGANADPGGEAINAMWRDWCRSTDPMRSFHENVSPETYYALMTYCDVMVGNSSAMLYEAPSFGLPCVMVGDRQKGRMIPGNIVAIAKTVEGITEVILVALKNGRVECENPYGDGRSAPRIVKALEENNWRWLRDRNSRNKEQTSSEAAR